MFYLFTFFHILMVGLNILILIHYYLFMGESSPEIMNALNDIIFGCLFGLFSVVVLIFLVGIFSIEKKDEEKYENQ